MSTTQNPTASAHDELLGLDRSHLVHGYGTPARGDQQPAVFVEGSGVRLVDANGETWIDAMAGLWNVAVGYRRAELAAPVVEVLSRLGFVSSFGDNAHEPGVRLAAKLAGLCPAKMNRFFFTGGGSDANETAIKLARYVHAVGGAPEKNKVIARRLSYHGVTMGALSATGDDLYWSSFGPRLEGFSYIDQPTADDAAEQLEQEILRQGPDTVAAFIAEPISLPSRVTVPPPDYWPRMREICTQYDVALIFDEVVTGFGRTGRMFAHEHWAVCPDFLVLSKGITSGYLPLGAVGMTDAFYERLSAAGELLLHGFTTGGNPASCAVALANIGLIEDESLVENAARVGEHLHQKLNDVAERHTVAGEVRAFGLLAAIDLVADSESGEKFPAELQVGGRVLNELRDRHVLARSMGDTMIIGPSLVATPEDINEIVDAHEQSIVAASANL